MGAVVDVVVDIVRIALAAGGIYLTVGLVAAMIEAQVGAVSGLPYALARVTERIVLVVFCFAVVVSAGSVGGQVAGLLHQTSGAGDTSAMWGALAQMVVRILVLTGGAIMTLFTVSGSVAAQLATLAGHPNARATAIAKIGLALLTGILTLLSVKIVEVIIAAALG